MFDSNILPCKVKCSAYLTILNHDWSIKCLSESHSSIIFNFKVLINTNHMFGPSLQEDLTNKLWMASEDYHEF